MTLHLIRIVLLAALALVPPWVVAAYDFSTPETVIVGGLCTLVLVVLCIGWRPPPIGEWIVQRAESWPGLFGWPGLLFGVVVFWAVGGFWLDGFPLGGDIYAVLLQAETYASGLLKAPAPPVPEAFNQTRFVVVGDVWTSQCLPGWAVILMPLTNLMAALRPAPPEAVMNAVRMLRYRDFLTVCLILDGEDLFPDNWIYVHDGAVNVGRIQSFKNWSPHMVPDPSKTSLGLEYFCNQGDALWTTSDQDLIDLGGRELETIGLARQADVEDGVVYRMPYAYPVYDADYADAVRRIRTYLEGLPNLQTIGRNGLHRYNNQDHSMLTGLYAVRNLNGGTNVDIWKINGEDDYHEEIVDDAIPRT